MRCLFGLLTSVALGALSSQIVCPQVASAADMPLKAVPMVAPAWSWTGFYVGGNLGGLRDRADFDTINPNFDRSLGTFIPVFEGFAVVPPLGLIPVTAPAPASSLPGGTARGTALIGGVQAGYSWQLNQFVFGVEADADATSIHASLTRVPTARPGDRPLLFTLGGSAAATSTLESNWMATLRGRIGAVVGDQLLVYGTGGFAFTNASMSTSLAFVAPPGFTLSAGEVPIGASTSRQLIGWTAGFGAEWAIDRRWSLAAEYRHADFGSQNYLIATAGAGCNVSDCGTPANFPMATNVRLTADQVTVRLNRHFY
jgi:outer membrane immunogenic protein